MGIAVQGGIVPVYDIVGKSPSIDVGRDVQNRTREVEFSWANADSLITECIPGAPTLPGLYPGSSTLYVESLKIAPMADERSPTCGDVISYTKGIATITYTTKLDYDSDTLVTRKWNFSGEFMTIPANSLKWDNNDAVQNEEISAAKIIPMIEHSLTRHRATTIPWTSIKDNIGKVNTALINDSIFDNVAAETLLYMGASIDWTLSTDGSEVWTIEHRFQERKVKHGASTYGWNHFWRPDLKRWEKLKDDAGNNVYPLSSDDFAGLFP